jgi:hypothetical protein
MLGRELSEGYPQFRKLHVAWLLWRRHQLGGEKTVYVLDLAAPLPVRRVELIAQYGQHPGVKIGASLETVEIAKRL